MKIKALLFVTLVAFTYNAISQTLYVPSGTSGIGSSSTANVGIGTTNPLQKFVVSNASAEGLEVYLGQPAGTVGLQSYNRSISAYSKMEFDASQFAFKQGNVGIGTTNPSGKFGVIDGQVHINSTGTGSTTINDASTALVLGPKSQRIPTIDLYYPGIAFNHLLNYSGSTYNSANHAWIGLRLAATPGSEQSDLVFATKEGTDNNSRPIERMCIKYNGNVGIGTTSPRQKLEVVGKLLIPTNSFLEIGSEDANSGSLSFTNNLSCYNTYADYKGNVYFRVGGLGGSTMGLQKDGTVVIGVWEKYDNTKIDLQGNKLLVNGGILCEEIKVITDVPSADYVFYSDYNLRTISELEAFVKENKHLPDIPSADQFKKDGYKIGEMDEMLLRKVEEFSLYLIEQNKRFAVLEKENNELKARLDVLENNE